MLTGVLGPHLRAPMGQNGVIPVHVAAVGVGRTIPHVIKRASTQKPRVCCWFRRCRYKQSSQKRQQETRRQGPHTRYHRQPFAGDGVSTFGLPRTAQFCCCCCCQPEQWPSCGKSDKSQFFLAHPQALIAFTNYRKTVLKLLKCFIFHCLLLSILEMGRGVRCIAYN